MEQGNFLGLDLTSGASPAVSMPTTPPHIPKQCAPPNKPIRNTLTRMSINFHFDYLSAQLLAGEYDANQFLKL